MPTFINYKFECISCNYKTEDKSNYNRHLMSDKHKKCFNLKNENYLFKCQCNKTFKYEKVYNKHVSICNFLESTDNNNLIDNAIQNQLALILIEQLQKKDQYLQQCLQKKDEQIDKLMSELIQMKNAITSQNQITGNHNIINNNKINNTNLNMALFLDNYCKNALNMSDFMKSMEVQLSDLLHTKDHGIIKGITNIFLNRLKELDIYERPIHCTDVKRLTMYVKDNDKWHEGDKGKQKISDTIQNISALQIKKIPEWEAQYSKKLNKEDLDDQYIQIVHSASSNVGEKEEDKIIRAIAKDVTINKKSLEISE